MPHSLASEYEMMVDFLKTSRLIEIPSWASDRKSSHNSMSPRALLERVTHRLRFAMASIRRKLFIIYPLVSRCSASTYFVT